MTIKATFKWYMYKFKHKYARERIFSPNSVRLVSFPNEKKKGEKKVEELSHVNEIVLQRGWYANEGLEIELPNQQFS